MKRSRGRGTLALGIMSGTSADGIDVALVRLAGGKASLENFAAFPFPRQVQKTILRLGEGRAVTTGEISQLNFLLGELFAGAALAACKKFRVAPAWIDVIGSHGQTVFHQGARSIFNGHRVASTLQIGEPSVIAARTGITTVGDFRPADMAAGGQGAPLVPFVDFLLYRHPGIGRVALNIGGIANVTVIPAAAKLEDVVAFDTGPGNMVIDGVMQALFERRYDRDGKIAAGGKVNEEVVTRLLRAPFFRVRPPRTAGREEFGREYVRRFLHLCGGAPKADAAATATALTARSIAGALQHFVLPREKSYRELIVSGGGAKNRTLMAMLRRELAPLRIELRHSDEFGVPAEAKEALAFAVLAYETWHRRPSNVPSATGAVRPAILGKISYV